MNFLSNMNSLVHSSAQPSVSMFAQSLSKGMPGKLVDGKVILHSVDRTEAKVESGIDIQLLLDVSGSMAGGPIRRLNEELQFLLFQSGCVREGDFVSIAAFNSDVTTVLPWTRRSKLSQSSVTLPNATGGTELWHAIHCVIDERKRFQTAKNQKRMEEKKLPRGKKPFVLLVLTDGDSSESKRTADSVKARIATIGINHEVAHFHMHVLGINLGDAAEMTLQDVCSASMKKCQVTNIRGNLHATDAIRDGFRKVFTKVINTVTKRTIMAGPDGSITVRDQVVHARSVGHRSHPAQPAAPRLLSYSENKEHVHKNKEEKGVCTFGARCRNLLAGEQCKFYHEKGHFPCKFWPRCDREQCAFSHAKACKFKARCTNTQCKFSHVV